MKVIGITGGMGAGKSTLAAEFEKYGAKIIDADKISKEVAAKDGAAYSDIARAFGKEILEEDGIINRKKLAAIVFSDKGKLELLNKITHKYIYDKMIKELNSCTNEIAVLDVPLLFQCDFPIKCDLTIAVVADIEKRIERIIQRDKISREAALSRIKNQLSDDQYRHCADVCFENNGDQELVKEFVKKICN